MLNLDYLTKITGIEQEKCGDSEYYFDLRLARGLASSA